MKWRHDDVIILFFWIRLQNLPMTTYRIETWQADSSLKVPQNIQIWKPWDKKWRHNDIITKNNGKCRPTRNQTNYISIERYWWELSKNVLFIEFDSLCQKLWAIMSNFGIFYDARSPNMAMSRDPRSKFQKFYLFLILHLILRKAAKFLVEKLSTLEVISQKPHQGGWKTPPPPALLGLTNIYTTTRITHCVNILETGHIFIYVCIYRNFKHFISFHTGAFSH